MSIAIKKRGETDLTVGPIFKKLIIYALPIIGVNVIQLLFNAADVAILGIFAENSDLAVAAVGSAEQIADQIRGDAGAAPRKPKRKVKPWSLGLILLGLPLWLPLLLAAASVIISIYVSIWAVIISLYATAVALGISSIVIFLMPLLYIPTGNVAGACLVLGAALVLTGITILFFVGLNLITKGVVWLTKKLFTWIKHMLTRKEAAQ